MNVLEKGQGISNFYELIATKFEFRKFSSKSVPVDIKLKILDAARLTGSGMNAQHWRFILVQNKKNLKQLADDSTTGLWVEKANFAVLVLTNPKYNFHMLDAGRAIQSMMLAAWSFGVASGIYVGINAKLMARDFAIPANLHLSAVIGFGYPATKVPRKKDRKQLSELAYLEKFGKPFEL